MGCSFSRDSMNFLLGVEARELRLTGGGVSGGPVTLRFLGGITVEREE